jgi:hypothetical protein
MNKISILIILTVFGANACSTYKPRNEGFGKMGYEETKFEDGTYKLSYYGSTLDNEDDAREKWNKRAAELCGKKTFNSKTSNKEWTYDNYVILLPLLIKSRGAAPLIEGKLACNGN